MVSRVSDVGRSADFWRAVGMREIHRDEQVAVLELRGGTHLVLLPKQPSTETKPNGFDLMVEDVEATHARWTSLGFEVGPIEKSRVHRTFRLTDPDGCAITINDSHVVGAV